MNFSKLTIGFGVLGTLVSACASSQPSGQLVQARQAMHTADARQTVTYAPKDLYEAQRLLAKAEAAHKDDARSSDELHFAYLAHRVTLLAMARSQAEQSRQQKERNQGAYTEGLEHRSVDLKSKNAKQEMALVKTQGKLEQSTLEGERTQLELTQANANLGDKERALAAETQARLDAEQATRNAIASLQSMAAVKEDKERLVITFAGAVLFESGRSVLLAGAREKMMPLANALKNYRSSDPILIEGHTDDRGSDSSNQQLSQSRAEAVRVFLIEGGVPAPVLVALGKGESQPVAANASPEGRANNRRVEIIVPHRDQLSMRP